MKKLVLIVSILITSCTFLKNTVEEHTHVGFTKHYKQSLFQITENKLFSIEMVIPEGHLKVGKNDFDLIIHDRTDRDLVEAKLNIEAYMPEMGHGIDVEPEIQEKGGGLYKVKNFPITMSGHWQLIVTVSKDNAKDKAVFEFPQIGKMMMHKHQKKPTHIDTSRKKVSQKGLYIVSYKPEIDPIRLNTIHYWSVNIKDSTGRAVSGASIKVEGDMPEHGHGMPTEPTVVEEPSPGQYIIDGFKFQMPGWWVVKIHITTSQGTDTVEFQLDLK